MTNNDWLREFEEIIGGTSPQSTAQHITDRSFEEEIRNHKIEENRQYERRNELYSTLLQKYISLYEKKEKGKRWYKLCFFIITMALFVAIVIGCLYSIHMILTTPNSDVTNIGVAITNIAGIITTIIVLPKTIADHLFPTNEETIMLEMVRNMQENDANIRELINKEEIISTTEEEDSN